jgi:hypothetical protein
MSEGGTKRDEGKIRLELHPFDVLESVGKVWTEGAKKYTKDGIDGARNWEKGFVWSRLLGAVLRHLFAWGSGKRVDPEWGASHLDHALCSLMMLRAHELRGLGRDDMTHGLAGSDSEQHEQLYIPAKIDKTQVLSVFTQGERVLYYGGSMFVDRYDEKSDRYVVKSGPTGASFFARPEMLTRVNDTTV